MAPNYSSLFDEYYQNYKRGLEGSIIPNMDSTGVNQQYDSSAFYVASYTTPYIPSPKHFSELMPFPDDLPSQMRVDSLISDPLCLTSSSYSSPFFTNYNTINELMAFQKTLPSQMGVEQKISPLNTASSSSYSSFVINYDNFNKMMPNPNEREDKGFMGTAMSQNEFENFNGLMSSPNDISQTASGVIEQQGSMPIPNHMPSETEVEDSINEIVDLDAMDPEFLTKWLDEEEEFINHQLTNDGALDINTSKSMDMVIQENLSIVSRNYDVRSIGVLPPTSNDNAKQFGKNESLNILTRELNIKSKHNDVWATSSRPIRVTHTSNNDVKPFGKRGLLLAQRPTNKAWESRRLKNSTTVQITEAYFHIPDVLASTYRLNDDYRKAGAQMEVQSKSKKVNNLSLDERQKGWIIETRRRVHGFHEKFYHHKSSKKAFRSSREVENFIFNKVYPPTHKRNTSNKKNQ